MITSGVPLGGQRAIPARGLGQRTLTYGSKVAIHIRGGDWLRYRSGRWGINLGWSGSPMFEWVFEGGTAGSPVKTGTPCALSNLVEKDYLFSEPRDWGINLMWLRGSGKYAQITELIRLGKPLHDVYKAAHLSRDGGPAARSHPRGRTAHVGPDRTCRRPDLACAR